MVTDAPQGHPGFWNRLSRTTKIVIVVDVVVLAIVLIGTAVYLAGSRSDGSSEASSATTSATTAAESPIRTPRGLAYIAAACGGAMTLQDLPNSPLPRADEYAVCLAPGSGAAIVIGLYDDGAALDGDLAEKRIRLRYATRIDESNKHWLVLVEGDSAAPLAPLQRYGFETK